MIQISKNEAKLIREKFSNVPLPRTCKLKNNGKKRGKYYVQESNDVLKYLKQLRNNN